MVSRENTIIGVCVVVAVGLWLGLRTLSGVPEWALFAVLVGVGVVLPSALVGYRSATDGGGIS
ncbi:hypothetical protein [Halorarius halobius]|uniref:hypothetical protein n=1 Tax=Halorarius halobius TaxID=2962671 RepID=UPI0020CCAAA4|nr:hypothetical protein [Halorarius halobius]